VYGSLLWLMDHTSTPFGKRMLQKWVSRPLLVREAIEERLAAVSELVEHRAQLPPALQTLEDQLASLPDLERALARLQYLKVFFFYFLNNFEKSKNVFSLFRCRPRSWLRSCARLIKSLG